MMSGEQSESHAVNNLHEMSVDDLQDIIKQAEARLFVLKRRHAATRDDMVRKAKEAGLSLDDASALFGF